MAIRPIKHEADYEAAVAQIEQLCEAERGTEAGDPPEVLVTLVEAYEEREFALPAPDPIEAIKCCMESRDLKRRDLEPFLGSRAWCWRS